MNPPRIFFVRIGRMISYAGPQKGKEGDERPEEAGKHNVDKLGHEAFNFGSSEKIVG